MKKWLIFGDVEYRDPLPVTEGGLLAHLGFMLLEGYVWPPSVQQYVSAVSRFDELQGLESHARTRLVSAMIQS